jgi:hypothetical protein
MESTGSLKNMATDLTDFHQNSIGEMRGKTFALATAEARAGYP